MNIRIFYLSLLVIIITGALYLLINQPSNVSDNSPVIKKDTQINQTSKPSTQPIHTSDKSVIEDSKQKLLDTQLETEKPKNSTVVETEEPQEETINENFKIDTSWQSRSVYREGIEVFYSFGAGNPPEVSLNKAELEKLPDMVNSLHITHTTYMTQEAEWAMKELLDNSNLLTLINRCTNSFPVSKNKLSMESILYVDSQTGRKEFDKDFINLMGAGLTNLDSPMEPMNEWKKCLGEYDKAIFDSVSQSLSKVNKNYIVYGREVNEDINYVREIIPEVTNTLPPDGYIQNNDADYLN